MKKDISCSGDMLAYGLAVCAVAAVMFGATGCLGGGMVYVPSDGFAAVGTADGIRAWGDYQNGQITEVRSTPGQKSAYWQAREQREVQETQRDTSPGFWGKIASAFGAPQPQ